MRYEKMWYDLKRLLLDTYHEDISKDLLLKMAQIECKESKTKFREEGENCNLFD